MLSVAGVMMALNKKIPQLLLTIYILLWSVAAVAPLYRKDWLLENILPAIVVPLFVFTYKRFQFSNTSYYLLLGFMSCHVLGAHYSYASVPYDQWSLYLFSCEVNDFFGWTRNHYDRLVHFAYGLLVVIPYKEWLASRISLGAKSGFILPLEFILASSALYELIEWGAAVVFGGDLGMQFLGAQGDVWDAHWDIFLAMSGAIMAQCGSGLYVRFRRA